MVHHLEIALEHCADLLVEGWIGVQTRHFVLILVRHELEEVARDDLSQTRSAPQRLLRRVHLAHKVTVLLGVGRILVSREKFHTLFQHFSQRWFFNELNHLRRLIQRTHGLQIMGAAAAPLKSLLVAGHLHAVELHGAHQRCMSQRHFALLPGIAQHHGVGINAVAQQGRRGFFGIKAA